MAEGWSGSTVASEPILSHGEKLAGNGEVNLQSTDDNSPMGQCLNGGMGRRSSATQCYYEKVEVCHVLDSLDITVKMLTKMLICVSM